MHSTIDAKAEPDSESLDLKRVETNATTVTNASEPSASTTKPGAAQNGTGHPQFPPPKTDKPRPHVCGTCGRSFARLEHLKRHERSHTKEKPFECPECTRCFARRDLLLRHQQKLHLTGAPSRPRNGRRESVSGASNAGSGRVRKNSTASNNGGLGSGHRPRANTISHIDLSSLGLMDPSTASFNRMNALGLHPMHPMGMNGLAAPMQFDYRGMSSATGHHGNIHGLPKLDLSAVNNFDMSNTLHTAPPMGSFAQQTGFDLDQLFSPGTTVNPAQLHSGGPVSATAQHFSGLDGFMNQHPAIPEGDDFGWMRNWNMQIQPGQDGNEQAIDESSPSRLSSGDSPDDYSESMSNSQAAMPIPQNNLVWQHQMQARQSFSAEGPFQLEVLGNGLPNLDQLPASRLPEIACFAAALHGQSRR